MHNKSNYSERKNNNNSRQILIEVDVVSEKKKYNPQRMCI